MQRRFISLSYKLITVCLLTSVIFFWGSTNGYPESVRGVTDTTIKIGTIMDLTGPISGDLAGPVTEGIKSYTNGINDNGGIFGRKMKLIIEDSRYSIPMGVAAFKKVLFKDKVFALFGPPNTGTAKVLYKHIEKFKVPNISAAPSKAVIDPLKRHVFLPFNVYDDQMGVIYDHIINELKPKQLKITLVYPDVEYGKMGLISTKKWAKHFNFNFDTEVLNLGSLDATSQVLSIKRKKTSHIIMQHTCTGAIALLRDLKKFGLNIPVYGTLPTCGEDTVRMGGDASKNFIGTHSFSAWYSDSEGIKNMRKITLKHNPEAEKHHPNRFFTGGWVVALSLYEGIKRAGKDLTIENLIDAMESIRDLDTKGICGPITYTPTDHKGLDYCKLYKADPDKGILVPITEWRKPPETK